MKKKYILLFILVSLMFFSKVEAYEEYKIGDKIFYKNDAYYVIDYSDNNTNYVTLFKEKAMTNEELSKYGRDENGKLFVNKYISDLERFEKDMYKYPNDIASTTFYDSEMCRADYVWNVSHYKLNEYITDGCTNDFNLSDIKKIVDNWSKDKFNDNDLVSVDNYKVRMINEEELKNNLNYSNDGENIVDWFYKIIFNHMSWIIDKNNDNKYEAKVIYENEIRYRGVYDTASIHPVINLNKCKLGDDDKSCKSSNKITVEDACTKKVNKYKEYQVCSQVEYNGDNYYVIDSSDSSKNYVTLLKINPLSLTDINNNSNERIGKSFYSVSSYLNGRDNDFKFSINHSYEVSYIKKIIDNWEKDEFDDDLVSVDGYTTRLIDYDDKYNVDETILNYDIDYWILNYKYMSFYKTENSQSDNIDEIHLELAIRPVINLKKDRIENINDYQVGDIVTFKNNDYYIIKISDVNYITLLKKDALTQNQVNKYGESILTTYDNALILTNTWADKFKDDLVEVNGKKSGLLSFSDFFEKFGYDSCLVNTGNRVCKTDLTPTCLDSDYWYWITDDGKYSLSEDDAGKKLSAGPYIIKWDDDSNLAIRPMLNVKKCSVEGGCYEEEEEISCEEEPQIVIEPEKEKTIIEAENTFKTISYMLIIIGSLLIIGGYILYKRIKKEIK